MGLKVGAGQDRPTVIKTHKRIVACEQIQDDEASNCLCANNLN